MSKQHKNYIQAGNRKTNTSFIMRVDLVH